MASPVTTAFEFAALSIYVPTSFSSTIIADTWVSGSSMKSLPKSDNGIDANEFAPKLIGKNKKGEMVFGYAKLPYLDYKPAILSSLKPRYNDELKQIEITVENFGLSASKESKLELKTTDGTVFSAQLSSLEPYGNTTLKLDTGDAVKLEGCELTITASDKILHQQKW